MAQWPGTVIGIIIPVLCEVYAAPADEDDEREVCARRLLRHCNLVVYVKL